MRKMSRVLAVSRIVLFWMLLRRIEGEVSSEETEIVASKVLPVVINTWGPPFTNATAEAWRVISSGKGNALDAVESGCSVCEAQQCDGTVGFGGSPNEDGETTLDAMIMDGVTHDVGSVGCLKRVKKAISVARSIMEHTTETLLVGDDATRFALQMGFKSKDLHTNQSRQMWKDWKNNHCQPNFWRNVIPDPEQSCGPYSPKTNKRDETSPRRPSNSDIGRHNHDTIGMVIVDSAGNLAAGTSTNGANHKIAGRVGDSPIAGAGAYVDNDVGGAAATGDGDIMMRFLPSFQAVELMRQGKSPTEAASLALRKIAKYYPKYNGGLVVVNKQGEFGAAAHGWKFFKYSVCNPSLERVTVYSVRPVDA
ncbi:PREDICTED: N(4)-(Beta-N-acetylglucosaminyl)-L-asparaginase-like isoform X1 [Acropora digitifera]|uniref:N(4)-(Beta-N-acetylglucosaminyl)-L-asparaginase- like isoform X1 n=1 Tax=Acropora digitifera TaxID=70779 RepID=UPI00077A0648|nr:PREDICTED: N(4)-(Beta-N-acetylglucosaminyl)-L-asparaginase-like isoform X1 [Acropora digitifera]